MLISAKKITKNFHLGDAEICVLDNIDFCVDVGEKIAILGPSGSGKSTLLNTLSGLTRCTSGSILFQGEDITEMNDSALTALRLNNFGFIFQSYHLISSLTVIDNILVPILAKKEEIDMKTVANVCNKLNITHRMSHYPHQLSGGEMQRVAIARAIVSMPKIIFSDEATGNLDETNSHVVMELLNQCCADYNISLVYVTHDESLVKYADKVRRFTSNHKLM